MVLSKRPPAHNWKKGPRDGSQEDDVATVYGPHGQAADSLGAGPEERRGPPDDGGEPAVAQAARGRGRPMGNREAGGRQHLHRAQKALARAAEASPVRPNRARIRPWLTPDGG